MAGEGIRIRRVGVVSYVDSHDLPLEEHYPRARAIVASGSEFAIVGNIVAGNLTIFRMDGVQRFTENVRIPEMPWFDILVWRGRQRY